jgi:hypothetical protein
VASLSLIPRMLKNSCVVACVVALWLVAPDGGAFAQQSSGVANEKTVLRGTVINSVTGQPIGRAVVHSSDNRFATMTNDRGRFEMVFKVKKIDVPNGSVSNGSTAGGFAGSTPSSGVTTFKPGSESFGVSDRQSGQVQQVTADRPDFLTATRVGFLKPQTSWGEMVAVAHDQDEVTITLTPEAKVVGHVTLADGEGAAGIPVELYRRTVQDGRARWVNVSSALARSDGEFRFADLEAGTYKLYSAELQDRDPVTSDPRGQGYGYPPDYYPGATDFAGGALIHISAGETFQASLTPEKRRYYPVHIGVASGPGGDLGVEVERDGHPGPGFTLGYDFRDGSIGGMLPDGNYRIKISTQNDNGLRGFVNLSVHGGPAAGMVTLMPGADVEVRVSQEFESSAESMHTLLTVTEDNGTPRRVPILLQLVPAQEFDSGRQYQAKPSSDQSSERMVVPGVPAGEYRVTTQVSAGYVAAIRCGDTDLQRSNLVIGGGSSQPPIEVTLRNDGAEIDGSIAEMAQRYSGNGPFDHAYVYLVPTQGEGEVKTFISQPNGDFQIAQLAPGTYRVLAFARARNDVEFSNEDVMRKYDAPVVTVGAGQKTKIQVVLSAE